MARAIQQLIKNTQEELSKITGLELSAAIGVTKEERGWKVALEMIEKRSIPDKLDILGTYEVTLDNDSNVLEFNRTKLRKRADTEAAAVK